MKTYSRRYEAALVLAAQAHRGQVRKVGGVPYITHVVHVSTILLRYGYPEDVVIAGLLHDIVEDTDIPLEQIEADFGSVAAGIVAALSERKLEGDAKRPGVTEEPDQLSRVVLGHPSRHLICEGQVIPRIVVAMADGVR